VRLLGGFPAHYYDVTYDAPGAPELAARIEKLMPHDEPVNHDPDRRLDHGAYVPLTVMYPAATIPGAADLECPPWTRNACCTSASGFVRCATTAC
jgi:hypothetical protein